MRPAPRILLVSLNNIGDLVFSAALVPPLRRAFPAADITLWCKAYASAIAPLIPGLDGWIAADPWWDRAPGHGKGDLRRFLSALCAVRRGRYDVALLASAEWRVAAAVRLARVPRRIGMARSRNARHLTEVLAPLRDDRPVVAQLGALLGPLGIHEAITTYELTAAPLAARRAALRPHLGDAPVAVLHAFAGNPRRTAPLRVWLELAAALECRGFTPHWIGRAEELERVRRARGSGDHPGWQFGDQIGDRTLAGTTALIAEATLFVGHDSGPLHIASALGIPAVGVYAPGEPHRTAPQGPGISRVLARPSPTAVDAEAILATVEELLGAMATAGGGAAR